MLIELNLKAHQKHILVPSGRICTSHFSGLESHGNLAVEKNKIMSISMKRFPRVFFYLISIDMNEMQCYVMSPSIYVCMVRPQNTRKIDSRTILGLAKLMSMARQLTRDEHFFVTNGLAVKFLLNSSLTSAMRVSTRIDK